MAYPFEIGFEALPVLLECFHEEGPTPILARIVDQNASPYDEQERIGCFMLNYSLNRPKIFIDLFEDRDD